MNLDNYISLSHLCLHYQVAPSFFVHIEQQDLIRIQNYNGQEYIAIDDLQDIEKMVRLYHELNVHEHNMDIVFNLIKKIEQLQEELKDTKKRLSAFQWNQED